MLNTLSKIFCILFFVQTSYAQLIPITENELSDMSGQAFINVDRLQTAKNSSDQAIDTTKITLGLDIKTSVNADLLDLGNYERNGSAGSDIRINDFALGRIDSDGKIVPFEISDPFIELAFDTDAAGKENLIGLRLGFGGAKGALSGNIESLTGKINIDIFGRAAPVRASTTFGNRILLSIAGIGNNTILRAGAELVQANGEPNAVRSTIVGVPNRTNLSCIDECGVLSGIALALLGSTNCNVLGIDTCFPIDIYRTLEVGNKQTDGSFTEAPGLFLSFLSEKITWEPGTQQTETGAFLNVPNGGLEVDFEQAFNGIERARTKYVDPYYD
ncbi:conserved hypothetical protein [Oleispira antarctica RB-8]|uniref:Uncharacterized protein n=1 Tax=Oleispira antarctica RB-8 TaxID=698738 RepID=R4YLA4_OLEAN|nr:conserved hypothetical protein [Oleispira antarctica RB-8]